METMNEERREFIKDCNVNISIFMGAEWYGELNLSTDRIVSSCRFPNHGIEYGLYELQYHVSWNWLMPVVLKIESLGYGVKSCRKRVEVWIDDETKATLFTCKESTGKFDSIYKAVVTFIEEYYNKGIKS